MMIDESIRDKINEYNPDAIVFDGLDEAIIGVGQQWSMNTVAIYDKNKCVLILAEQFRDDSIDYQHALDDALEYFNFNVECLYAGKNTPIIVEVF